MFRCHLNERISQFAPQLTLDFISETCAVMNTMDAVLANAYALPSLQCLSPWIKNIGLFLDPTSGLHERSASRMRDCIRVLSDISTSFPDVRILFQRITCGISSYPMIAAATLHPAIHME